MCFPRILVHKIVSFKILIRPVLHVTCMLYDGIQSLSRVTLRVFLCFISVCFFFHRKRDEPKQIYLILKEVLSRFTLFAITAIHWALLIMQTNGKHLTRISYSPLIWINKEGLINSVSNANFISFILCLHSSMIALALILLQHWELKYTKWSK